MFKFWKRRCEECGQAMKRYCHACAAKRVTVRVVADVDGFRDALKRAKGDLA